MWSSLTGPLTAPGGAANPPVEMSQALSTSTGALTPLSTSVTEALSHGTSRALMRYPLCSLLSLKGTMPIFWAKSKTMAVASGLVPGWGITSPMFASQMPFAK